MKNGVVMVAFGAKYIALAYQAAASVVKHNPELEVDLFTDSDRTPGPFSRVHILQDIWIRSKVDAMLQSRFDKTLYLDVDLLVLADLGDIFAILENFDVAAAHDQYRNTILAQTTYRNSMENAFPQINSGVLAFRKKDSIKKLLINWKMDIKNQGGGRDQQSLRELLWKMEVRLAILPPEYNLWDLTSINCMTPEFHVAPRIVHGNLFQELPLPAPSADVLTHYLGKARAYKIRLLLASDRTLAQRKGRSALFPTRKELATVQWLNILARGTKIRKQLIKRIKSIL